MELAVHVSHTVDGARVGVSVGADVVGVAVVVMGLSQNRPVNPTEHIHTYPVVVSGPDPSVSPDPSSSPEPPNVVGTHVLSVEQL